jgi:hypothetical protein
MMDDVNEDLPGLHTPTMPSECDHAFARRRPDIYRLPSRRDVPWSRYVRSVDSGEHVCARGAECPTCALFWTLHLLRGLALAGSRS